MDIYNTGNKTVDAVGKLNISGNIIPEAWYKTITKENTGKPNLRGILFLADIVYWYRPVEIRDELTGQVIGYKKKMYGNMLQRSYLDWSKKFGCSKGEATATVDELVGLGVIVKELRTIVHNGIRIGNVVFLGLNVNKLIELTYLSEKKVIRIFIKKRLLSRKKLKGYLKKIIKPYRKKKIQIQKILKILYIIFLIQSILILQK